MSFSSLFVSRTHRESYSPAERCPLKHRARHNSVSFVLDGIDMLRDVWQF